ncbi:MAG: M60 family metallopeptidase [Pseudoflavonifractor sp.]|nr:M60 family metallopeptidase [Pseudoflavonifractor sp.]
MNTPLRSLLGCCLASMLLAPTASAQYKEALDKIFSDAACTTLSAEYASMSLNAITASDTYKALPSPLQEMVRKVKTGDWTESSVNIDGKEVTWDSEHALKYRVQMVEPFSDGYATSVMMDCKPHTNLSNPTGFITDKGTTLYIFVEGEIKPGASLYYAEQAPYLAHENMPMYNDMRTVRQGATELKPGLNVVTAANDGAISYFHYIAETFDTSTKQKKAPLSSYPDLKIHVEGGRVNGFFNIIGDKLYTPDTHEDLTYCLERAAHPDFALIGRSFINIFPLTERFPSKEKPGTLNPGLKQIDSPDYDPIKMMNRWEDFVSIIQTTAGFKGEKGIKESNWADYYECLPEDPESYADYFNNRLLNIIMTDVEGVAMWSTNWYNGCCAYSSADMMDKVSDLWGPAHEYGHTVQGPIKIVGSTEISNNLFSNVVNYLMTNTTSRTEYISDLRKLFNEKKPWMEGLYWSATRMYWQLWLYYHQQGHDKQFYLRLQDILRRDPLTHSNATDYLKFAKAACQAAGEDLTDFFDAYGLLLPLNNYAIEENGIQHLLNLSEAQVAACRAEIAAMNLPKNRQVIFIDDRPGSTRESKQGYPKEDAGQYGGLDDFAANSKSDGKYTYSFKGTEMTVSGGKGGVGFIVYSSDGRLLSFSNTLTFDLSPEAAQAAVTGDARVYSVDADGTLTEIPSSTTDTSAIVESLELLIAQAEELSKLSSPADKIIGQYYSADIAELEPYVKAAKEALVSAIQVDLSKVYTDLSKAVSNLKENPYSVIRPADKMVVTLVNVGYPDRALADDGTKAISAKPDASDQAQQWVLESTGKNDCFYIRNKKSGLYIQAHKMVSSQITMGTTPEAFDYIRLTNTTTALSLASKNSHSYNLHIAGNGTVVYWTETETNNHSQWLMTAIEGSTDSSSRLLGKAIADTRSTLSEAGSVTPSPAPVELTEASFDSNAKCGPACGSDMFTSWSVLLDNDPNTFFHTNWAPSVDTDDKLDHWISIALPEPLDELTVNYTTRGQGNVCAPMVIKVESSTDGKTWVDVTTLSGNLPSTNAATYISPEINLSAPASHIRLMVTQTYIGQQAQGHQYFVMSELGVGRPGYDVTVSSRYPVLSEQLLIDTYRLLQQASQLPADDNEAISAMTVRVKAARQALLDAMATPGAIDTIGADALPSHAKQGIYDLQGRRLREATAPGLYIINGRKTLIR